MSLLSCVGVARDPQLQQLCLQLHLEDAYLQTQASDYHILFIFFMVHPCYQLSKRLLAVDECFYYEDHPVTLSIQHKFNDSMCLETCCGTWKGLC